MHSRKRLGELASATYLDTGRVFVGAMASSSDSVPNAVYATLSAPPRVLESTPFFRAFICSFVANARSARLYLFTHPPETTALLSAHLLHPRITILRLEMDATSFQQSRYASYLNHLRSLAAASPARIALVDATDVVFQADPFDYFAAAESRGERQSLYFTEESRDYTLGQQSSNSLWVRELYGAAELAKLQAEPVLCSGFTMGHAGPLSRYLRAMREEGAALQRAGKIESLARRFGRDQSRGFDQGIHNVLTRSARLHGGGESHPASNVTERGLRLLDGPVLHGNGARAGRHFLFEHSVLWTPRRLAMRGRGGGRGGGRDGGRDGGRSAAFAVAHQYGKMRPKSLQARMRRELTCREAAAAPRFCSAAALCANPNWLGAGREWNRTAP